MAKFEKKYALSLCSLLPPLPPKSTPHPAYKSLKGTCIIGKIV